MARRRVILVAMPCAEVVEVDGALDIFYAANLILEGAGAVDLGYDVEVVSPVATVRAWAGLRLVADRSYRAVRGGIDTVIVTGIDGPEDAGRDPDLVRWLARTAPRVRRLIALCTRVGKRCGSSTSSRRHAPMRSPPPRCSSRPRTATRRSPLLCRPEHLPVRRPHRCRRPLDRACLSAQGPGHR